MADKNIYLLAKYIARPKNPKMTHIKGYVTDPDNMVYDEQVTVTRGLRNKDLQSHVILNLTEEKIHKNTYHTSTTFEEAFKYFHEGYANQIDACVNTLNP